MPRKRLNHLNRQPLSPIGDSWSPEIVNSTLFHICPAVNHIEIPRQIINQFGPWIPLANLSGLLYPLKMLGWNKDIRMAFCGLSSRRFEGGLFIRPGCSARPATARLRRACWGAHSRAAVDPTDTTLHPIAPVRQGFSPQISIGSLMGRNLKQNMKIFFHLNCVTRQHGWWQESLKNLDLWSCQRSRSV